MQKEDEILLPAVRLEYQKNDLIVKEGDYGISIYQVLEGQVEVFIKSDDKEISIVKLGAGEIIGEMIFLTGSNTRRSASVRAIENSVLEAWHPTRISKEYEQMPFIIRYIADQSVNRLVQIDRRISELSRIRKEKKKPALAKPVKDLKQRALRKSVHWDCMYRPADTPKEIRLWGRIKNISKTGIRLDVMRMNALDIPHDIGKEFKAIAFLSNDKKVEIELKITNLCHLEKERTLSLGLKFVNLNKEAESAIGFFLLGQ